MPRDSQDAASDAQLTLALTGEGYQASFETRGLFSKTYLTRHIRSSSLFASLPESAAAYALVCRLVRVGSAFVPLAVERVASRVTDEGLLAEVRGAARLGRDVLKAAGLRLLGTGKGVGFGARVLAAGEQADPARRPATRRPARPRRGDRGTPGDSR